MKKILNNMLENYIKQLEKVKVEYNNKKNAQKEVQSFEYGFWSGMEHSVIASINDLENLIEDFEMNANNLDHRRIIINKINFLESEISKLEKELEEYENELFHIESDVDYED